MKLTFKKCLLSETDKIELLKTSSTMRTLRSLRTYRNNFNENMFSYHGVSETIFMFPKIIFKTEKRPNV